VILIDANILLYAHDRSSPHHEAARVWLETTLSKPEPVGLSWLTILAFLRISTNPRVLQHPFSVAEAVAIVAGWLQRPTVTILHPSDRHWEILQDLMIKGQAHGPLATDAHLAALAIEQGATLATADRDFTRFPGLRILNPVGR
jgi:toxin-antitoxin system PIN domain toxin